MAIDFSINGVDNSRVHSGEERLNQLSVSATDDATDMSNNLNIVSSLETYKKSCTEKHMGLPFELNISRRRRCTTGENQRAVTNVQATPPSVHSSLTDGVIRQNPSEKAIRRRRKIANALCFIGWIVFFPCCAVGFLMREPPESTDDLDTDPCWPGALLGNQDGDSSRAAQK